MPITTINKNILESTEEYVIQQCNCTTVRSHGLSKTISEKWPYCTVYTDRQQIPTKNLATEDSRSTPGTIAIYKKENKNSNEPSIICMYAQYGPGGPYTYSNIKRQWPDSSELRRKWFSECLIAVGNIRPRPKSLAIPFQIGCGLAKGSWLHYNKMLQDFSDLNSDIDIYIYKI